MKLKEDQQQKQDAYKAKEKALLAEKLASE